LESTIIRCYVSFQGGYIIVDHGSFKFESDGHEVVLCKKQRNGRSFIGVDIKIAAHQDLYILPTEGTGEASPSLFMLLQEPGMG